MYALLISMGLSVVIMFIIMRELISKDVKFYKAYSYSCLYYAIHNIIYCLIMFNISYQYKYVGDGYAPTIENLKTIIISDNNFICINNVGDSIYSDCGDNIGIANSSDLFIIEHKSVVMDNNISNYFNLKKLPKDSCILHIPNNIKIIKIK